MTSLKNIQKLKIMEVIYSFEIGGSEMLSVGISSYMKERGANISVCATHSMEGPISKILQDSEIECFAMNVEARGRIARRFALYQLFRKQKVDVLHIHHVSIFALCYLPAMLAGVKRIIVTEHNEIDLVNNSRLKRKAIKICKKIFKVTVIHQQLAEYFKKEIKLSPDKIQVIQNGVDTERFSPKQPDEKLISEFGFDKNDRIIGCIGRLHKFKNHKMLINAISLLDKKILMHLKILIVGDGEMRAELEKQVLKHQLQSCIIFLGERSDIPEILNMLDFLVLTSSTEGVPMIILEAMSSGVPCIATNVGGISEIISNDCGAIVSPDDEKGLAELIEKFSLSEQLLMNMRKSCRARALELYDKDIMFGNYYKILTE